MALGYAPKRRYSVMGLLGLGAVTPHRIEGVAQRVAYAPPVRCDKCGSAEIFQDITESRRLYCAACATDWFLCV